MNDERRKALNAVKERIETAQAILDEARSDLETLRDEEQEYYDNMPESFQGGDRGDKAQTAIDQLDSAISDLEGFDFDSITSYIDEAVA